MLKALWSRRPSRKTVTTQSELRVDEFSVTWRRSARRTRSMALRLDRQGKIIAMTPHSVSVAQLKRFVRSRADWLRQQNQRYQVMLSSEAEQAGRVLWLLGEPLEIVRVQSVRNFIERRAATVHIGSRQAVKDATLDKRLGTWLRSQAEVYLNQRLVLFSERTGLHGSGVQVKTYTARWGSCRHDGLIQLNWKLIKTPPEIIDYVIVHELCHLQHFNHSAQFWQLVASHCPEYPQHRVWLKTHGGALLNRPY